MKADEFREMEGAKLQEQLDGYYQEMFNLRFQKVTGKLTNTARQGIIRRDIARIKTVQRERQLEQSGT